MHNQTTVDPRVDELEAAGYGYIIPIICCVGILFNILNILVLLSGQLPQSTYTYLTNLAIADLLSLLLFGLDAIGRGHYPGVHFWACFEVYVYFNCGFVTTTASVFLTVTVSAERYIFIYKPLKAKRWCQQWVARRMSIAVWVFCLLYNVPRFFVFTLDDNGSVMYTSFGKTLFYRIMSWVYFISISVGAAIALIVLNILLFRGVRETGQRRRNMVNQSSHNQQHYRRQEMRLTRTLISVIILFLVGEIPSAMVSRSMVVAILGRGDTSILNTFAYKVAALVAIILVVSQHSLNFIVYCVFNKKFYAIFRVRLTDCKEDGKSLHVPNHSTPAPSSGLIVDS